MKEVALGILLSKLQHLRGTGGKRTGTVPSCARGEDPGCALVQKDEVIGFRGPFQNYRSATQHSSVVSRSVVPGAYRETPHYTT
jgi:hypothetical protein